VTPFLRGFGDELVKCAGVLGALGGVGKLVAKHPLIAMTAGMTAIGTGMAARNAYKEGLQGGEKPRYLAASVDPGSGRAQASDAAYTNYHPLFAENETPKRGQLRRLSRHYHPNAFKR
jgi:hypothetical protein